MRPLTTLERVVSCSRSVRHYLEGVSERLAQDVAVGVVRGTALDTFRALVTNLYHPVLCNQQDWGKLSGPEHAGNTEEFLVGVGRFGAVLSEAVSSLTASVELAKPAARYVESIDLKPQAFNRAAADPECCNHMDETLERWVEDTLAMLDESQGGESSDVGKENSQDVGGNGAPAAAVPAGKKVGSTKKKSDDAGPDTELEYWRNRMSRLNSVTEQLNSKPCRLVLGVTMAARSKSHRAWKSVDLRLTDAVNEAKDNVKYLATLEKSLEPMYTGTPAQVTDGLPVGLAFFFCGVSMEE